MAKLARRISYGKDAIYHGTRHPVEVLRSGKLMPSNDGAVYFTRSPEEAARFANLMGNKIDNYTPALLVFSRTSLAQRYRLSPSRYQDDRDDEREEHVCGRAVSVRRHLLGVIRDDDVTKVLGPSTFRYVSEINALSRKARAAYNREKAEAISQALEGRAAVRELIVRDRERRSARDGNSTGVRAGRALATSPTTSPRERSTAAAACKQRRRRPGTDRRTNRV
jgi:hypothetical protein